MYDVVVAWTGMALVLAWIVTDLAVWVYRDRARSRAAAMRRHPAGRALTDRHPAPAPRRAA